MKQFNCAWALVWALVLGACSGTEDTTQINRYQGDGQDDAKPLDEYDWTTPSEADGINPDDVPGAAPVDEGEALPVEGELTPLWSNRGHAETDKGTTSMLLGIGLRGNLHFQDGVCTEPDCGSMPDHCSLFGLTCDNAWHSQARQINYGSANLYYENAAGACGPASSLDDGGAWAPCAMPNLYPGHRNIKWRTILDACPNDLTARQQMLDGWAMVRDTLSGAFGIGVTFTETTGADWNVLLICEHKDSDLNVLGSMALRGQINLKYALAVNGGPNNWVEDCDTSPGYPGSGNGGQGWVAVQQTDMMYAADKFQITVDMVNMTNSGVACTSNNQRRVWGYHNMLLHEMGHVLGLTHDNYTWAYNQDFPVMVASDTCAHRTNRRFNFHPFYRNALDSFDISTTQPLTVWDDDISCFKPFEY